MISVSTDGLDPVVKQELSSIADMVLSFKVRTVGTDFENSMIVSKFRNAPENLKILVFRVTPEEGITPETVERIA
jgi:archaellum biogenesis ATPase FlaH